MRSFIVNQSQLCELEKEKESKIDIRFRLPKWLFWGGFCFVLYIYFYVINKFIGSVFIN